MTGLPGIEKSWTLFYDLQQTLLYDGANVIFFFEKTNDAVLYIRRKDKIYAWLTSFDGREQRASCSTEETFWSYSIHTNPWREVPILHWAG
jgi:hypothetical protein